MKSFLLIIFTTLSLIVHSQWSNFIPNYSFENVTEDYPVSFQNSGYLCPDDNFFNNPYNNLIVPYWLEIEDWTHPLRKNICLSGVGTANVLTYDPGSDLGGSEGQARSGIRYGNGTPGEILVVPLKDPLEIGKTYYFECFNNNDQSIKISNNQPKQCGGNALGGSGVILQKIGETSSSTIPEPNPFANENTWRRTRLYFTPIINAEWLSVGDPGNAGDGLGGGNIDDIRIYEVTNDLCRDNWYFDNTVFNYPVEIFRATDKIYIGEGTDPESNLNGGTHISGSVKALAGSNTVVKAGNEILIDGTPPCNGCTYSSFEIEEGAYFETVIEEDCGALCPITTGFPEEVYVCDGQPTTIGDALGENWGTEVSWFPQSDLDAYDVMNPTFTPPSNSGQRTYTVVYNNICNGFEIDQEVTYEVTVIWKDYTPPQLNLTEIYSDEYEYEFEIDGNDGVDQVNIEISDGSQIVYNTSLHRNVDFTSFPFNWSTTQATNTVIGFEVPINFSSCKNHVITVTAINKCDNSSTQSTLNWYSSTPLTFTPPLPNTFTPNGDGVNDEYCISNYTGADSYEFIATIADMSVVATGNGSINSSTTCIWDGTWDDGTPPQFGNYFLIVILYNDCGVSSDLIEPVLVFPNYPSNMPINNEHEMTNNLVIFNYDNDSTDYEITIQNTSLNDELGIYPNPSEGKFWVKGVKYYNEIKIYDPKGKCIYTFKNETGQNELNIDVSHQVSSGIYNLVLHSNTGKDVVQLVFN